MSQFDYPRINFRGKCTIDPGTGNNGWYLPLVIFDPIHIRAFLPPRIYLEPPYLPEGKKLDDLLGLLPREARIRRDRGSVVPNAPYVEIAPICNAEIFLEWAKTPLGSFAADRGYHALYETVVAPRNRGPLTGSIPGYWNYFGGMAYSYQDVRVSSVALPGRDGTEELFAEGQPEIPPETEALLGATLTMNNVPGDPATNSAVMVDLLPTMAMYSQVFCDSLALYKEDRIFFKGNPLKGSLRLVNPFRVVNENMPHSGSGVFMSALPLEALEEGERSPLVDFFRKHGESDRPLKGLFIEQMICEVGENRSFDYPAQGQKPNPAKACLAGSITPWYEGDMRSWVQARQLTGDQPYLMRKLPEKYDAPVALLPPVLFRVDADRRLLTLDILNAIPMLNTGGEGAQGEPQSPGTEAPAHYETYDLGTLTFKLEPPGPSENQSGNSPHRLATRQVDSVHLSRNSYLNSGGILQIPVDPASAVSAAELKEWDLVIYGSNNLGAEVRLWKESPLVITSDEAGLYVDQHSDPVKGYRSYSGKTEPCRLRIFERGSPRQQPLDLTIVEYKMTAGGSTISSTLFRHESYSDGDSVTFPTEVPSNAIYLFLPQRIRTLPKHGYPAAVVKTGFFVNVKVLPVQDYGKYLYPEHPEYPTPVTFEVLFEEVLRTYALITPVMSFRPRDWKNPAMAMRILQRTDPARWNSAAYMPISRDLSHRQRELIVRWAANYLDLEENPAPSSARSEGPYGELSIHFPLR